jgi:hypothetical protein
MSLLHLFKISYYFDANVGYDFPGFWAVVTLLIIILAGAIWFGQVIERRKNLSGHAREFWQGWIGLAYILSIIGLVYLFLRYENIMYFNWRLWPALLILGVIGRGISLIYIYKRILPKRAAERENQKMISYYFRRRRQR